MDQLSEEVLNNAFWNGLATLRPPEGSTKILSQLDDDFVASSSLYFAYHQTALPLIWIFGTVMARELLKGRCAINLCRLTECCRR